MRNIRGLSFLLLVAGPGALLWTKDIRMNLIKQQSAFNEDYARISDELIVVDGREGIDELSREGDVEPCFDPGVVYASQTFAASLEGQVCVLKGDSLEMIDDSNSYWWLVKCSKTSEIGYIPAEIVETPLERLARINKNLNLSLSQVRENDFSAETFRSPSISSRTRSVGFEKNSVRYIDDKSDNSDDGLVRKTSMTSISKKILPSRRKVRRPRETMGSIVGIDETTQKSVADKIISDDLHEATSDPPVRPQSTAVIDIDDTEPISVLRVYAGNTDLKATFKTVNFDRFMTARELLRVALQRFRVALSMESNYYLGVLHMDSQKKRLKDDDIVYEVLESLRSKHLPGVSGFTKISRVVNEHGLVSRVLMNDDNIIRVIINKEDASTSNQVFLARIFVRHEGRAHTEEHVYKTLALAKTTTVGEAVSLALKKFRLLPSEDFVSCLYQKTREEEVLLPNNETLASVVNDQKDASENLFVLAVKWAGEGPEPQDLYSLPQYSSAQRKSLAADINDILNLRPDFLNDSTSQQSPTIESDAKHAPNNGSDHNSDPLNQKCHGSSDHGQLVNSIDGLFNTIRASSDVKKSLDNGQISPEAENNCTWSHRSSGNSDNQVDTPPRDELVPATRASSTILDTHSRYSSPLYSSAQPPAQNSSPHSTPLQKSTPTPDPPSKPHNPARPLDTTGESASPDTDSNCHDPSSQGDPPDKIHGSPPLLPKKKCFKHSSTPLPATTKDLKPPVRKDSNVVNLTMAFDTVSVVKEGSPISQQDSTGSGVKMKKRSKSFDAMERYLEEIMSSGCQSNALNELEIKLKMATIENGSDS